MKQKYDNLQGITLIAAIMLLVAIPDLFFLHWEYLIECVIFFKLIFLTYKYYQLNLKIYAVLFAIAALIYNPIFWMANSIETFATLDIMLAILCFLLAISLNNLMADKT